MATAEEISSGFGEGRFLSQKHMGRGRVSQDLAEYNFGCLIQVNEKETVKGASRGNTVFHKDGEGV